MPVIRGQNLAAGRWVDMSDAVRVSEEKVKKDLAPNLALPGDLIFTQRGTLGQVAIMPSGAPVAVVSQSQMRLRVDYDVADPGFVYYWAKSPEFLSLLSDRAIVSGVPHINLRILADMPIPLPPRDEQRRIGAVLGALDEAIENEGRLAAAADNLWRGTLRARSRTWEQHRLIDLASFINGRNFTKGASGAGRPVIRTPEVRTGPSAGTIRSQQDAQADNIARFGDILFVWSGSLLVGRWVWEPGLINQHIFKVIPRDGVPAWVTLWAIEELMDDFMGVAADKATTMGHIKRSDLDRSVVVPSLRSWTELDVIIRPLWEQALESRLAANQIAKVRDELLPLLMSGQLRVSECFEVA